MHYLQEPKEEKNNLLRKQSTTVATSTTSAAAVATKASFTTCASQEAEAKLAIDDLVVRLMGDNADFNGNNRPLDLVYLFVGQYHAESFEEIVTYLQVKLGKSTTSRRNNDNKNVEIVTILGGGVIGGGAQLDQTDAPAMTLLAGTLPPDSSAAVFQYEEGVDTSVEETLAGTITTKIQQQHDKEQQTIRPPSYMIFSDPFAPLDDLLVHLEEPSKSNPHLAPPVVAGGVSVPPRRKQVPSIARNGHLLPAGSLVGIEFTGNVGLMAVVSQGCRPVGPTYVITQASGTVLTGLSGESAITRLDEVAADAEEHDQELIRNGELVCGIGSSNTNIVDNSLSSDAAGHSDNMHYDTKEEDTERMIRVEDDFLVRQIMGFQPKSGSIVVAAGGLKEGSTFRFHVRAAKSAREDMDLMIRRAKTERLFAGSMSKSGSVAGTGKPIAAFQISCVARDSSFYGAPDVDLKKVKELFDDDESSSKVSPVAGFFANGEIGPVGIRSAEMAVKEAEQADSSVTNTFLHGFTTVVAMLCDYSGTSSTSQSTGEVSSSAILGAMDDDAWA